MKGKARDIFFTVIMMAISGFLCFSLGLFASWKFGLGEQRILIQYEVTEPSVTTTTTAAKFTVDLNAATVEDLLQVDGIGEKTAEKIIAYRNEIGQYTFIDQLLDVDGVGDKKLENWKNYLTVEVDGKTTTTVGSSIINLNTATKEELMRLDGVGEKTALKIIAYREKIGGFTNLEQLMDVDGIGEKKFATWKKYLTVE